MLFQYFVAFVRRKMRWWIQYGRQKCKNIVGFAWKLLRGGSNSKRVKRDENRGCDCTCKYLRHSNTVIIKAERCCIWIGIINPISNTKYRSVGSSGERDMKTRVMVNEWFFVTIVSSPVPSIIILHIFLSIIIPMAMQFLAELNSITVCIFLYHKFARMC